MAFKSLPKNTSACVKNPATFLALSIGCFTTMIAKFNRSNIHYCFAALAFAVYGIRVCPFLDSLSTAELLIPILTVFAAQYLGRKLLLPRVEAVSLASQAKWQFSLDLKRLSN